MRMRMKWKRRKLMVVVVVLGFLLSKTKSSALANAEEPSLVAPVGSARTSGNSKDNRVLRGSFISRQDNTRKNETINNQQQHSQSLPDSGRKRLSFRQGSAEASRLYLSEKPSTTASSSFPPSIVPTRTDPSRTIAQPESPSLRPSSSPSNLPTSILTAYPSDVPSDYPSKVPSELPSDFPSVLPSSKPSFVPSDFPSMVPPGTPSAAASSWPSDFPSYVPSTTPTVLPSIHPSYAPSLVPSVMVNAVIETMYPSDVPLFVPSGIDNSVIETGIDIDINSARYNKQTCSASKAELNNDMSAMVVDYSYNLVVENGFETNHVIGSVEDYLTKVLRDFFCIMDNIGGGKRRQLSPDIAFSAIPADLPSDQSCLTPVYLTNDQSSTISYNSGSTIDCILVDGGFSIWFDGDQAEVWSPAVTLCNVSEQLHHLFFHDTISMIPGVKSCELVSISPCHDIAFSNGSLWQLSYVITGSGAFAVLTLGLLMRNRYSFERRSIAKDERSPKSRMFDISETGDMTMHSTQDTIYASAYSACSYSGPKRRPCKLSVYQTCDDECTTAVSSGSESISSDSGRTTVYDYTYGRYDNRGTIVIDSKLLSLSMTTIFEAGIAESSSSETLGDGWEKVIPNNDAVLNSLHF